MTSRTSLVQVSSESNERPATMNKVEKDRLLKPSLGLVCIHVLRHSHILVTTYTHIKYTHENTHTHSGGGGGNTFNLTLIMQTIFFVVVFCFF